MKSQPHYNHIIFGELFLIIQIFEIYLKDKMEQILLFNVLVYHTVLINLKQ